MKAIFLKEIKSFFSNAMMYFLMASFLLTNALILWVFKGFSNVIYTGFTSLNNFFNNSILIFAILIPALTMKSFADEQQNGTLEILKTLPITHLQIILGKFWAYALIIFIFIIPTSVFVYTIHELANPIGNIDFGSILTAYLGLILVSFTYIAIGIFSSIITNNNISSFLVALLINAVLYFGFSAIENLTESTTLGWNNFGIPEHFNAMSRGVIGLKDVIYFISLTFLFLGITKIQLDSHAH